MNLYPNPTYGELNIRISNLEEDTNFIINDAKGSTIYSEFLSGHTETLNRDIDLSRYADGLYFVRLISSSQSLIKKVIKLMT